MSAKADTAGALVVLYGATTGRDGIGGASVLASQELGEEDADKRPSVQVGDPFTGKRLIEVSVELVERGLVLSLQDCGAAGLASSLSEMAADYGIDVHLDRVPQREEGMEPWEIMISESQERMVAIVAPDRLAEVGGRDRPLGAPPRRHRRGDRDRAPARAVARRRGGLDPGPLPHRRVPPLRGRAGAARAPAEVPLPELPVPGDALLDLLGSDALRSRAFVTRRYDQLVQSRTVRRPGLDAAVLRLRPSYRGLAVTLDGTGRVGSLDPFTGGAAAILEAARNVACAGGEPLGFTDCLNFGNPEKPEIGWELAESIEGMARACEALGAADRLRERLALQRHRRPLDPPDARRRLRRARARTCGGSPRGGSPAMRSCSSRRAPPRCQGRSCRPATAPSRDAAGARPRGRGERSSGTSSAPRRAARWRMTSPRAASPSRSPRPRSTPASARGSTSRSTR